MENKTQQAPVAPTKLLQFLSCLFLGWFGLDKLYIGGKKSWKLALVKFLLMFVAVGEIWNIYDIICSAMGKYKLNPLQK